MRRITAAVVALALALTLVPAIFAATPAPSTWLMFKEQVASQTMIGALLGTSPSHNSWVKFITFGRPTTKTTTKIVMPVAVYTYGGSLIKGRLTMYKYGGRWYFYSITRGTSAGGISAVSQPPGISSGVVANAITEQRVHQSLLAGVATGGYKKLTVTGRTSNWNTRQVNVRLSGGTRAATSGRVLAYSKTSTNGKKYWFINTLK